MENAQKSILVSGGAGFIGSHFVDLALSKNYKVVVIDALTYAGSSENLKASENNPNFIFVKGGMCWYHWDTSLTKNIKIHLFL